MGQLSKQVIAEAAYIVTTAFRQVMGEEPWPPWMAVPDEEQEPYLKGVEFHQDNADAGPDAAHNDWLQRKLDAGWEYGEVLDEEAKTDPFMVQFKELPVEQQVKDTLFQAVVRALSAIEIDDKPVVTIQATTDNMVGVEYIGDRPTHIDNLYGTRLIWTPGQVHNVDKATANKMKAHTDVYAIVPVNTKATVVPTNEPEPEPDSQIKVLPNLDAMDKEALVTYAQHTLGEKLPRTMSEATMRSRILSKIQSGR